MLSLGNALRKVLSYGDLPNNPTTITPESGKSKEATDLKPGGEVQVAGASNNNATSDLLKQEAISDPQKPDNESGTTASPERQPPEQQPSKLKGHLHQVQPLEASELGIPPKQKEIDITIQTPSEHTHDHGHDVVDTDDIPRTPPNSPALIHCRFCNRDMDPQSKLCTHLERCPCGHIQFTEAGEAARRIESLHPHDARYNPCCKPGQPLASQKGRPTSIREKSDLKESIESQLQAQRVGSQMREEKKDDKKGSSQKSPLPQDTNRKISKKLSISTSGVGRKPPSKQPQLQEKSPLRTAWGPENEENEEEKESVLQPAAKQSFPSQDHEDRTEHLMEQIRRSLEEDIEDDNGDLRDEETKETDTLGPMERELFQRSRRTRALASVGSSDEAQSSLAKSYLEEDPFEQDNPQLDKNIPAEMEQKDKGVEIPVQAAKTSQFEGDSRSNLPAAGEHRALEGVQGEAASISMDHPQKRIFTDEISPKDTSVAEPAREYKLSTDRRLSKSQSLPDLKSQTDPSTTTTESPRIPAVAFKRKIFEDEKLQDNANASGSKGKEAAQPKSHVQEAMEKRFPSRKPYEQHKVALPSPSSHNSVLADDYDDDTASIKSEPVRGPSQATPKSTQTSNTKQTTTAKQPKEGILDRLKKFTTFKKKDSEEHEKHDDDHGHIFDLYHS
jgi:hypothetical protein